MLTPRERLVTKTHCLGYKNAVIRLVQGDFGRTRCRRYSKTSSEDTAQGVLEDQI
jgi:hypothetical protein